MTKNSTRIRYWKFDIVVKTSPSTYDDTQILGYGIEMIENFEGVLGDMAGRHLYWESVDGLIRGEADVTGMAHVDLKTKIRALFQDTYGLDVTTVNGRSMLDVKL